MAGRNQHYIPQFLQRGFSAKVTASGRHQVLVFRKGVEPYLAGTAGTFVSRDFYGSPDSPEVDDAFTDEEGRLAAFVSNARACTIRTALGRWEPAATLVHQLNIRIRWVRELFSQAATLAVDHMVRRTATLDGQVRVMLEHCEAHPTFLSDEFEKHLSRDLGRPLEPDEKSGLDAIASYLQSDPAILVALIGEQVQLPWTQLKGIVPETISSGHIKALGKALRAQTADFRDFMLSLSWEVLRVEERLILGDCGPLYLDAEGELLGPYGGSQREGSTGLILPIAATTLLIGSIERCGAVPGAAEINRASAGWSSEAFIASARDSRIDELHASIGELLVTLNDTASGEAFRDL